MTLLRRVLLTALGLFLASVPFACSLARRGPMPRVVASAPAEPSPAGTSGESYQHLPDSPFLATAESPVSTFGVDVDTASYANIRRYLVDGQLPPADAVRIEELVNYFHYLLPEPEGDQAVAVVSEVNACPWAPAHRLLRIGLKARTLAREQRPPRNLTFLIDVSGSMDSPRKLPLLKRALGLLADGLDERDRVSIVVYAGAEGLALPPTPGSERARLRAALQSLEAGGSTNGGAGLVLAYRVNAEAATPGSSNRVILATDGDFNVGVTSPEELLRLIEERRRTGTFLTVLGFGMGNLKDATLEMLADKGNGNYAYIDSYAEARKVLVEDVGGTLVTVARDVKVQVELDRAAVESYRLVGYENRRLEQRDFEDDRADAGEMGAGHTVTALYELVPRPGAAGTLGTIKVRYQAPDTDGSRLVGAPVRDDGQALEMASPDFRFAAGVAAFGLVLRNSPWKGEASLTLARSLADPAASDEHRREFLALVDRAGQLEKSRSSRP
ncbi:MAG TPA: VWA domain-containing protein [Polyangia bacterium]|nr:VWA domain-containing protein [Polyangia bacterium]